MGIYKKGTYAFSTSPLKIQYLSVIRLVAVLSSADLDTRAHCRSYNYALKVLTLSSGWLSLYNSVDKCVEVLLELLCAERRLTDRAVYDVCLI